VVVACFGGFLLFNVLKDCFVNEVPVKHSYFQLTESGALYIEVGIIISHCPLLQCVK